MTPEIGKCYTANEVHPKTLHPSRKWVIFEFEIIARHKEEKVYIAAKHLDSSAEETHPCQIFLFNNKGISLPILDPFEFISDGSPIFKLLKETKTLPHWYRKEDYIL